MSDSISGISGGAGTANVGGAGKQLQQSQGGGRSFESVMEQVERAAQEQSKTPATGEAARIPEGEFQRLLLDLVQRKERIPTDPEHLGALMPEMRTRMGKLREAIDGMGQTPKGTDLRGRFSQVAGEWNSLEALWRSDKELSSGELLGLQARLYQVTQHVEVLSKVVDQVTSGVKTILNTNV